MSVRLFAAATFACFLAVSASNSSSAGVIGGLDSSGPNGLAAKIESLYLVVLAKGSVPVEKYAVQEDDTIEKILRTTSSFKGGFFPLILDALTCDLNNAICKRPLRLANGGSAEQAQITNPLELELTAGDWSNLHAGNTIVVPRLQIDSTLVPRSYSKRARESVDQLMARNEVCLAEKLDDKGCRELFDYMNFANPKYSDADYAGNILVPGYDYLVSIPDNCDDICAVVTTPILIGSGGSFTSGPYELVSQSNDLAAINKTLPDTLKVTSFGTRGTESLPDFDAAGISSKSVFSKDVLSKILNGSDLVQQKLWKNGKASPFSEDFSTEQSTALETSRYPVDRSDEIIAKIREPQAVLIVDSQFDRDHCDFDPSNFVVYDCTNADDQFANACPMEKKAFAYDDSNVGSAGPGPAMSTPAPSADSNAAAVPPDERERCGDAGQVVVDSPVDSDSFIKPRHGTHLAGIIAAKWDGFGAGGINPTAQIVGVEVNMDNLDDDAYGRWLLKRLKEIMYRNKVHVVDLSLGFIPPASTANDWLSQLINDEADIALFVVAAGNKPDPNCVTIPACRVTAYNNIAAVVALTSSGDKPRPQAAVNANFSLGADGDSIFGPAPMNRYVLLSGSSQAAAVVAGAASLAMSLGTGTHMLPSELRNRLITCANISNPDLLDDMRGGSLDIACLIAMDEDQILLDPTRVPGGQVIAGKVVKVGSGNDLSFFNIDTQRADKLNWDQVLAFQRIGNKPDDMAVFVIDDSDPSGTQVRRLRGSLADGQSLTVKVNSHLTSIDVAAIEKYVRRFR